MIKTKYLYRGLNESEIKAKCLLPKKQEAFKQLVGFPVRFPIRLTKCTENAARNHQKDGYETSGVSTSKDMNVASRYATRNNTKDGVIAKISVVKLRKNGIGFKDVNDCGDVAKPEDCEIILYNENGEPFQREIIDEFINIKIAH